MTIKNIANWFDTATPEADNQKKHTQIGVHLEEIGEMLETFIVHEKDDNIPDNELMIASLLSETDSFASLLKQGKIELDLGSINRKLLLDSLCDQIVTAIGIARYLKMDIVGALAEVDRSNWSKFENGQPIKDHNGKILKGKNYSQPVLDPFV